jgi:rubrerythrin
MFSTELLVHFSCQKCSAWWSIATQSGHEKFFKEKDWHCPWCGHINSYTEDTTQKD